MDNLRAYLLSEKNFGMLESIILDKLYNSTGISLNRKDPLFEQNMVMIATAVIRDEIKTLRTFGKAEVIKINNIIIVECVRHLSSLVVEPPQLSSQLDDISDTASEVSDFFEELKIDNLPKQEIKQELKPEFVEELLVFDEEITVTNLKNVVSAELISISIDFSDYIVTEHNNSFCIDNIEKEVPIGNYTPEELLIEINNLVNPGLYFKLNISTDTITIYQQKIQNRSMTGAIKDRENQKQINIDFGTRNSISKLIGFSPKTYIIKENDLTAEVKHNIKHPSFFDVVVTYDKEHSEKHMVLTNVQYNSTIHYTPPFSKKVLLHQQSIEDVSIKINMGTYNHRGRRYMALIKFTLMTS